MIKAVIFDFYGVICADDLWEFIGEDKQSSGKIHDLADEVNLGKVSWDKFCQKLADASDRSIDEINDMYRSLHINRAVVGLMSELKQEYKIGILTNASRTHIEGVLADIGAAKNIDALVVSSDVGIIKPQPGIYREMTKRLDVEPEECLFIDDANRNVDGAKAVGMKATLFKDVYSLSKELKVLLNK